MKNIQNRKIVLIVFLTMLLVISAKVISVNADSPQFVLDPLPTVRHEVVSQNAVDVATHEEFEAAMLDQSIDEINFTADIIFDEYGDGMGFEINRDLRINGNGHTLVVEGSSSVSPNVGNGALAGSVFNLGTNGFSGIFHLKDINIYHNREVGNNTIVSVNDQAVGSWDVIFDNLIEGTYNGGFWFSILDTPANTPDTVNLFLRNKVELASTRVSNFTIAGKFIIEPNAVVRMDKALGNVITASGSGIDSYKMYVGENADVTLYGSLASEAYNYGAIDLASSIDIYNGANLTITSESRPAVSSPLLSNRDASQGMDIRIDSNASLVIASSRKSSAVSSTGANPLTIVGNPGSSLEIVTGSAYPTVDLGYNGSYISMLSPDKFSIQNVVRGPIFASSNPDALALKLENTNVGLWNLTDKGYNKASSSFKDVTYISSINGLLEGSSEILSTIPTDSSLSKLSRIDTINFIDIAADDIEMQVGATQNINPLVTPLDAELTYSSDAEDVVSVDSDGNLTAHKQGDATITIHAKHNEYYSSDIKINITVNAIMPILNVPAFTETDLNSEFDPKKDVTAFDYSGSNISDKIDVKGKVDVDVAGIYVLEYTVTDNLQNTTTAKRVVLVNDSTYVYDNGFIIHGQGAEILFTDANSITDQQLIEITGLSVYSIEKLELIENPNIIVDRSKLLAKPGVYPVTFTYNPSITINLTILDEVVIDLPGDDDSSSSDNKLTSLPNTGQVLNLPVIVSMLVLGATIILFSKREHFKK